MRRYVATELIRFGHTPPEFHTFDLAPKRKVYYILPDASLYLKNGEPWSYPYHKVIGRFPGVAIKVHYPTTNSPEWSSVVHGNATPETILVFTQFEGLLAKDPGLPLKQVPAETKEEEPDELESENATPNNKISAKEDVQSQEDDPVKLIDWEGDEEKAAEAIKVVAESVKEEEPKAEVSSELESELVWMGVDDIDYSSHLTKQNTSVGQVRQNGQAVRLFGDVMLDSQEKFAEISDELESEFAQAVNGRASSSSHPMEQIGPIEQDRQNGQAVGLFDDIMLDAGGEKVEQVEPPRRMSVTELSLDNLSAQQEEEIPETEVVAEETHEVEEPDTRISPLVINTWFHSLDGANDYPRAVVNLNIIHQESPDHPNDLSDFPHLEELHFIKVNTENFEGLISVPKQCNIKLESREINGWMGRLDLEGLKKLGCYSELPPKGIKRLLEEEEVEIYLFTPTRANETETLGDIPSASGIQMNHEEAFAK